MKKLFIITGPCGVGKTTLSKKIWKMNNNSCLIDGDYLYHMINTNDKPSSDFSNGSPKLNITFKNSVDLINNFLEKNMDVIFEYIVFPENLKYILDNIKNIDDIEIKFILLLANENTIFERNKKREKDNSKRGIELIRIFKDYNFNPKFILMNDNLDIEEATNEILTNDKYIVSNKEILDGIK